MLSVRGAATSWGVRTTTTTRSSSRAPRPSQPQRNTPAVHRQAVPDTPHPPARESARPAIICELQLRTSIANFHCSTLGWKLLTLLGFRSECEPWCVLLTNLLLCKSPIFGGVCSLGEARNACFLCVCQSSSSDSFSFAL